MAWSFAPRWKEMLVCNCEDGSLTLEFAMGNPTVYLPPADSWRSKAPAWALDRFSELEGDLRAWCESNQVALVVDSTASIIVG